MSIQLTISVAGEQAEALKEKIRSLATSEGISMSEWIVEAIAEKIRAQIAGGNLHA